MARVIKRKNDTDEKFEKFHLIKKVKFDDGILTMKIDEEVKEFYLELKQYTKYQLKNILKFKNSYSFRVYELLKQYESIQRRQVTIEDLRTILDIEDSQYPLYANLKQKVINNTMHEINSNTDISFSFKEIKTNRKVTSIKFFIKTNKSSEKALEEISATEVDKCTKEEENYIKVYIKTVQAIFRENITEKDAKALLTDAKGNVNIIKEKYDLPRKSDIGNVVGWVRNAIKGDYKAPKGKANVVGAFNDYEQRKYNFDKLEENLLGKNKDDKVTEEDNMSWEEKLFELHKTSLSEVSTII